MSLSIDKDSPIPLGEQLKTQVRLLIQTGVWAAGVLLPTVKELAGQLELNYNTVAAAYRDLEAEGLLVQRRRAGTRVAAQPPVSAKDLLATHLAVGFAQTLKAQGLDAQDVAQRLIAQAALEAPSPPLNVAVLARTPLASHTLATRTQGLLGEGFSCIPQTPESYVPTDYHLTLVDADLAVSLRDAARQQANNIPAFDLSAWKNDASFPAGAD